MLPTNNLNDNRIKLLENNRDFIYDTTSFFCNRPLKWGEDEELNIALTAFNGSFEKINEISCNFISYSHAIIKSALLDYTFMLADVPTFTFAKDNKPFKTHFDSLTDFEIFFDNKERATEIALLLKSLNNFSIDFYEVSKTKLSNKEASLLLNFVVKLYKDTFFMSHFGEKKYFKFSIIHPITQIDKKFFRKCKSEMISLLIILSHPEIIYLKSYLNIIVGDANA